MAEVKAKKTIASNATKAEKKPVKAVKAVAAKKAATPKVAASNAVEKEIVNDAASNVAKVKKSISLDVYGVDGKVAGKVTVPGEMFGDKVNKTLLSQAVRVYLANQRQGNASTKTRGEVDGSTRKIYRQKGTGRARHGSIRAPIFVKGGIVFGPKPRDFGLTMPSKMKRKALFSALSAKAEEKTIKVIEGFETIDAKTKNFVTVLSKLGIAQKKNSILVVTDSKAEKVKRAGRNVPGVQFAGATRLNVYEVLKSKNLLIMKEALEEMQKTF
jgi:large subunit ribosomal protein L4